MYIVSGSIYHAFSLHVMFLQRPNLSCIRSQGNWPEQTRIRSAVSTPVGITDKDVTGPEYRPVCLRNCSWRIPGAPEASRL